MPNYTLRRTWPDSDRDREDYVFLCDGGDVGRVYSSIFPAGERWNWTIYMRGPRPIEGVPVAGLTETLDEAKQQFRDSFEKMLAAGSDPRWSSNPPP